MALLDQVVNHTYVKCLQKQLYTGQTGQVQCDVNSRSSPIERGAKQGDPLNPTMFNAALEEALRQAKKITQKRWGLKVGGRGHGWITNLRFADDVLLFAKSEAQLTQMLKDLHSIAGESGLELHPDQSKILTNASKRTGRGQNKFVHIDGLRIELFPPPAL